ncbi:MAG TPA: 2-dehydropantoate 2-reductase [Streptosporangiaceae bacterium]|nr:2-dehydropantoate 2-reductase [Streptosporangiaceae bacterium]
MRILVAGAGATGGFFGARLAQAGRDVTFLVRPRRAQVLRQRGLRIIGPGAVETLTPRMVTAPQIADTYDLVLLSVKATALRQVLADLGEAAGPDTAILPFLNGIAHLAMLNERYGEKAVLGGVAKVATDVNGDGDIVQLAPMASLLLGEQDGRLSQQARGIGALMAGAGFDVDVTADIVSAMWHKWVFIATAGALTCLMRGTVGDIAAVPGGTALAEGILAEAAAVSAAAGFPVPAAELAATHATMTQAGSAFAPSMYRDVAAGRPAEAEHILGDLVTRAQALSVATPLLDLATLHLRVYQRRADSAA